MLELDHAVQKMVLESLGVRKERVDSHLASLVYDVRLSRYGALAPVTAGDDVHGRAQGLQHGDHHHAARGGGSAGAWQGRRLDQRGP